MNTPGNWEYRHGEIYADGYSGCIAEVYNTDGNGDENGVLMAAAKELRDALKLARHYVADMIEEWGEDEDTEHALSTIDAALAKAGGEDR